MRPLLRVNKNRCSLYSESLEDPRLGNDGERDGGRERGPFPPLPSLSLHLPGAGTLLVNNTEDQALGKKTHECLVSALIQRGLEMWARKVERMPREGGSTGKHRYTGRHR